MDIDLEDMPIISVSRALGHFVSDIDIDLEAIVAFYKSLNPTRPLAECHIHLSALYVFYGPRHSIAGATLLRQGEATRADPHAPIDTTIILFIGTRLAHQQSSEIYTDLAHELTHFGRPHEGDQRLSSQLQTSMKFRYKPRYRIAWFMPWGLLAGIIWKSATNLPWGYFPAFLAGFCLGGGFFLWLYNRIAIKRYQRHPGERHAHSSTESISPSALQLTLRDNVVVGFAHRHAHLSVEQDHESMSDYTKLCKRAPNA